MRALFWFLTVNAICEFCFGSDASGYASLQLAAVLAAVHELREVNEWLEKIRHRLGDFDPKENPP